MLLSASEALNKCVSQFQTRVKIGIISQSQSFVNILFTRCVHNNVVKLRWPLSFQNTLCIIEKIICCNCQQIIFFNITYATKFWTFDVVLNSISLFKQPRPFILLRFEVIVVNIFSYFPRDLTKSETVGLSHANNLTVRRRHCLSHERWRTVRFKARRHFKSLMFKF